MKIRPKFNGVLPYHSIGEYYKTHFGEKVYKLSVTVSDDCPNRRGLKGMKTCIFCDPWGSAAYTKTQKLKLEEQIEEVKSYVLSAQGKGAKKFLVYFQAYTSTFTSVKKLRAYIEAATIGNDIVGFVIGTRPDCLSPAVFDLINEYSNRYYFSIELGVQSFDDNQLEFMRRGHTAKDSIEAINKIYQSSNADIGIHLMFGLPGETESDVIKAAETVSQLPIQNVKLHNLHVLTNTPLADLYKKGEFTPLDLESYTDRAIAFITHLPEKFAIQRLSAVATRWDELVAPAWTRHKMKAHQFIVDEMNRREGYQGMYAVESNTSKYNSGERYDRLERFQYSR